MPVSTHAKNQQNYHSVTTHHDWKGQTHHNLKEPHNDHKILTALVVIIVLIIIAAGLAVELI